MMAAAVAAATTYTLVLQINFREGEVNRWLIPDERVTPALAAVLAIAPGDELHLAGGGMRPPVLRQLREELGALGEFHRSAARGGDRPFRDGMMFADEEELVPRGAVTTRTCVTFLPLDLGAPPRFQPCHAQ